MRFLLRVVFTAVAIWLVTLILSGVRVESWADGTWPYIGALLVVALVFGVINATLGNLIRILAFPMYILSLGIAALFVNALLLLSVHWISQAVGWGLTIDGFWWGFLAAILISFGVWLITVITKPLFGREKYPEHR